MQMTKLDVTRCQKLIQAIIKRLEWSADHYLLTLGRRMIWSVHHPR